MKSTERKNGSKYKFHVLLRFISIDFSSYQQINDDNRTDSAQESKNKYKKRDAQQFQAAMQRHVEQWGPINFHF